MSELDENTPDEDEVAPKLRRRLLGYKRADVQRVLEVRDDEVGNLEVELDERESELRELRQDVAALWIAFAQHDRMIKSLGEAQAAQPAASEPSSMAAPPEPDRPAEAPPPAPEPIAESIGDEPSVGRQLADLDEVLAAIEIATQTLEQTYVEEISEREPEAEPEPDAESERSGED